MTGMVGTCYFANGTALPVDPIYNQYQPCQSGGPSTICCGIFRDNVAGGNITAGDTMDELSSGRAGLPTTAPVSRVSSASTASTPTTGTEAPNKTPSAAVGNTGEDPSVTGGVIAGIVISGVIGLALLAAAVFFARRASKYKREAAASKYVQDIAGCLPQNPDQGQMSDYQKYMHDSQHTYSSAQPSELPPAPPSELPSFASPLPGTTLAQR
ncbi:unnamed protein product [Alternaria alternata]